MANVSINNITETWNSSGTTYSGIKYNVTDTASAAASKLIDLQVGGSSKFSVDKDGVLRSSRLWISNSTYYPSSSVFNISDVIQCSNSSGFFNISFPTIAFVAKSNTIEILNSSSLGWSSSPGSGGSGATLSGDLYVYRDAANTLAQRNGTNAQSYRLYLSYTDATNNSRFAINTTANYYRLASEIGTSTGSKKPIVTDIYQSTVDPTTTDIPDGTSTVWKNTTSGVVKLWVNNGGTLIGVALA